jgi:hypothetical protein
MSEELYYHLVKKSTNKKTGPIAVLTSSFHTCPDACPFKRNGCYADGGPLRLHWDKLTAGERGVTFSELLTTLRELGSGQLIRLFQAGDLPGRNNYVSLVAVKRLVAALDNWRAFGYTHKPLSFRKNAEAIKYCNDNGVCINLSANNLVHADELSKSDVGPVSVTLPKDAPLKGVCTPEGRRIVTCPAVMTNESITCSTCGGNKGPLCSRVDRNFIVGFPAHGASVNKASEIARHGFE